MRSKSPHNRLHNWLPALTMSILFVLLAGSNAQPVYAVSTSVVISEFRVRGPNGGSDEFIELYNLSTSPVNIGGWKINGSNNTAGTSTRVTITAGTILNPGCHYLVTNSSTSGGPYSGAVPGNQTYAVGITDDGGIALLDASNGVIDQAGMSAGSAYKEGTPLASLGSTTASNLNRGYERKPGGTSGSGTDTDNNSTDFQLITPSDPQNLSSTCVTIAPTPSLSISDVSMSEGSAGTTSFAFVVSLSAPAGAGGVTFDIATAIDSATAPSDFTAKSLTGQTIPAGGSVYTFTVLVNGDTDTEPNETFFVNVTNVTGATVLDGQGQGTIQNDDADGAPAVASTTPANSAMNVLRNANIAVNFNEPVNTSVSWFTLNCATSGAHTAAVSGGPTAFTLNPDVDFAYNELCTLTVLSAQVTDQDVNDPPDAMAADYVADFTTELDPCTLSFTPIYNIQGSGLTTPIPGIVSTKGVVVGDFEGTAAVSGFFMQDATGDGDPATSDGIFVYTGSSNLVSVGQVVRVSGYARERFSQTTINGSNSNSSAVPAANIVQCGTGSVTATDVNMPFASADFPERYEGMLVRLPQSLVIAEYFNYDRFGEMVLALPLGGEDRPFTGTAIDAPGAPANARTLANSLSRITLDDNNSSQNPAVLRHPNGNPFSLANRFRGGDTVQNVVGVLGYDFNLYRIFPTAGADYVSVNPRPTSPAPVGGSLRVAAMNTLNFFLSPDNIQEPSNAPDNPADNICGPVPSLECRGWDGDQPDELERQRTKLIAALAGLNADVIGLNEIENTVGVDPLGDPTNGVVAGLNALLGPGTYAYINTGVIGTDAIRVGLIYKPAKVAPVGAFQTLDSADDPRFIDTKSRPALAQTFLDFSSGDRFTVIVNHLKSKGSDCNDIGDPDAGDGQGNCSGTRTLAAQALVDWLATDPTGSGDPDFLIMGDLNSYAREDPITAIKAGADNTAGTSDDYTNLIAHYQGTYAYSYVFDGQSGYLDHALANASLVGRVTGATEWHINADEPDVLDYDTSFKPPAQDALYESNGYRSSDHDAVIVGLNLATPPAGSLTGGGWIISPAGAYPANPSHTGKGHFEVSAKYQKNQAALSGDVEFELDGAALHFETTSLAWLIIDGDMATLMGVGTINGAGDYRFLLSAIDGKPDMFRIQIWVRASGVLVYDSQPGDALLAAPTTALGGGSIQIHAK